MDVRVVGSTNEVFAISHEDSSLARSLTAKQLCRIYFSAVTDSIICIEEIREIINQNIERTVNYIYGPCWLTGVSVPEIAGNFPVAIVPNPATSQAFIHLPHGVTADKVEIIDMTGRVIDIPVVTKGTSYVIDVASFSDGIYLVRITSGEMIGYTRFSKN